MHAFSVVIPTYNSSEFIATTLSKLASGLVGDYEVVVVDDGSTDSTWSEIRNFCSVNSKFSGMRLHKNVGQAAATLVGILESKNDIVCTSDDDGQHDPVDLMKLVSRVASRDSDFIYGQPRQKSQGRLRSFYGRTFRNAVSRLSKNTNWKYQSSMRCFRADKFRINLVNQGDPISVDLALSTIFGVADVEKVLNGPSRNSKGSRYTFKKLVRHARLQLVGSSNALLGISGTFSIIFGLMSLLLGTYVLSSFLLGNSSSVPGFTFTSLLLTLSFSIQFFVLFVLGVYIGEIHKKSIGLPFFAIQEKTSTLDS